MNNTSLKYIGKVTIETTHRKNIRKNSGTKHLFRLFSSILARENFNSLNLPAYLMLYDLSGMDTESAVAFRNEAYDDIAYRAFKYFIDLNACTVSDTDEFETEFTALITAPMVLDLDETQIHSLALAIVAGDQQSLLAIVDFDHDIFTTIQSGGQAVVRWRMSLTNSAEEAITLSV